METTKQFITTLDQLPLNIGREVQINQQEIALFRLEDNQVKAVGNRCPHENGPLAEGTVAGDFVFCPLHNYKVSLTDGQVQAPDEGCVKVYRTSVEDGDVYVWA
ncbi:nitrite reductase small subunit NirD [Vagococcus sp. BWB3-3]|uniref:Nitrite reductase small subunit NirD n=1 Tax=Vagococcus allomyrinae TaxID=2794353 RepID=A0A940P7V1_9ENTE|nr:nitrite reductase small subunit NirD [Vagococcus allomyrinae]MBP1042997.1 nitrite reductase small subunit NirD [Vagococcus allomyrinae]